MSTTRKPAALDTAPTSMTIIPSVADGPATTAALSRVELPEGMSLDDLLEEVRGEW